MKSKITNVFEKTISIFGSFVDGIILQGSSAWSESYNGHDIDLELIVPNFEFFKHLKITNVKFGEIETMIKYFVSKTLDYLIAVNLEIFSLKVFIEDLEISLRFTKPEFFKEICCLDLEKLLQTKSVLEYRLYPTKPLNIQRNFFGERIRYKRWCFSSGRQQLIETPIAIVDSRGRFYPGEIIDRWLAFPKIVYEKNSFCQQNLEKLKVGIVRRLMFEEKRSLHKTKPSLSLCLSRKETIPEKLLNQLNKEESKIRLQIKNEVSHTE